ncbi:MAG: serine protease [Planctomycetia bacterium]|nr:serine protease [Planctomycetia bacterium]
MTSLSDFRTEPAAPHPAVVRIVVENAKSQNYGSGTWIRLSSSQCAVLTCAHLFDTETPRKISVYFSNHVAFVAQIQAIDRRWDIALLQTSTVDTLSSDLNRKLPMPVTLAQDPPRQGDYLRMCGYGPNGRSVWVLGKTRGYCHLTTVSETHTLVVSGVARQGDSGAPILNLEGVLVGVLWGTDGSSMYGTWSGKILQTFSVAFQENRVTIQKPDKVGDMEIAKKNEISGNSVDSGRSVSSGNSGSSEDSVNGTSEKTLEEQVAELAKMAENVEKVENTEGREKLEAVLTARKPFASFLERIALSRTSRMARTPRFPRIAQSREEDTENKLSPTPEPEVEMDLIAEILPPVTVAENTSGKNTGKMVEKFSGNMTGNI